MSRFYVNPDSVKDRKIYIEREESHHIIDVMRLRKGDLITVFDGSGKEYEGELSSIENGRVIIDILKIKIANKKRLVNISLAQAIPKKDMMDLIVQKATELGVDEIFPIESARTVVKFRDDGKQRKVERWNKIAIEASKQCGRTELPKIKDIICFDTVLDFMTQHDLTIMPCLSEKTVVLKSALKKVSKPSKILAIIGPEGDFSKKEIDRASEKGAILISLGNLILKSETAAITTLSILNYEYT
jgi:16S rRNA (uracil1498-N3)-methyltransferase